MENSNNIEHRLFWETHVPKSNNLISTDILRIDFDKHEALYKKKPMTHEMRTLTNINNAIDVFAAKAFGDIIKMETMFKESKSRGFSAELKKSEVGINITVMLYFIMGRIVVTLKNEHDNTITILGSSSPNSKPGLQGINCSGDQALDMLELVTSNWKMLFDDRKKILQTRFKKDLSISII